MGHRRSLPLVALVLASLALIASSTTFAASPAPRWEASLVPLPFNFEAGPYIENNGEGTFHRYELALIDVGGAPAFGPVTVEVEMPPGVSAEIPSSGDEGFSNYCATSGGGGLVICNPPTLPASESLLKINVDVSASAPEELTAHVKVSGGGAPVTFERSFTNVRGSQPPGFSVEEFSSMARGSAGEPDEVAGSHPTILSTLLTTPVRGYLEDPSLPRGPRLWGAAENTKDLLVDLPPGLVGNPTAAPRCPIAVFLAHSATPNSCPAGSQVGEFSISGEAGIYLAVPGEGTIGERLPIYNLVPEPGYPAEFGFYDTGLGRGILAQATLAHTSQGYVVRFLASRLPKGAIAGPFYLQTSFLGNPENATGLLGSGHPFLTAPASCSGERMKTTVHLDTWSHPAAVTLDSDGGLDFNSADLSESTWHNAISESPPVTAAKP